MSMIGLVHSEDLERVVLDMFLGQPDARGLLERSIAAGDFVRREHAALWDLMVRLNERDAGGLDIVTVMEELESIGRPEDYGGLGYVSARVCGAMPAGHHGDPAAIAAYCRDLREMSHRRAIQHALSVGTELVKDRTLSLVDLRARVETILAPVYAADTEARGWVQLADAADEDLARMEARRNGKLTHDVVPTGFAALDALLGGGVQRTNLVVLAGRPAMGKSAVALQMVLNAGRAGHGAGFFSLEMGASQLARRGIANLARVPLGALRTGQIDAKDHHAAYHARDVMRDLPVWIDDDAEATVAALRSKVRALKRLFPDLGLVVVDYLQLLKGARRGGDSRETEVAGMSRGLKVLAKSENVAVVCLAQLNRGVESRGIDDRRPKPSDLRESGAIEQDADVILFPYRHGVYVPEDPTLADKLEVVIGKQRDGDLGIAHLQWSGTYQRIEDAAEQRDRAYDTHDRGGYY